MTREKRHPNGLSDTSITVAVTASEKAAWKRSAKALDVSMSDLVRQSVAYYLEERKAAALAPAGSRRRDRENEEHLPTTLDRPVRRADGAPVAPSRIRAAELDADAPELPEHGLTKVRSVPKTSEIRTCPRCDRRNVVMFVSSLRKRPVCGNCGATLS